MSLVELDAVAVGFQRSGHTVTALEAITLTVNAGDRVAIVGGSGSGKTTLARVMLGLQRPDTGQVRFNGRSIIGVPEKRRGWFRASASMVFQDPNSSLDPRMRIRDILAEPLRSRVLRIRGDVPDPSVDTLIQAMRGVGLTEEMLTRYPHQLSGGQRQRVAIARALISNPALLVADEPVSALDMSVRAQVLNLLSAAVAERDVALVLISHDLAVVRHVCDRIVVMHRGRVVEQGPVDTVLDQPKHDYTAALAAASLRL